MSRKLTHLTLLFIGTTFWFIEFGYLWKFLEESSNLFSLILLIVMIWALNSSLIYGILKVVPLGTLNPPLQMEVKKKYVEEEGPLESIRSRFAVAQEFTTFGLCIATLLWLLRMYFLNEDGY